MIPVKDNIPLSRFPLITVLLVLANIIVYVVAIANGGGFFGGPSAHLALHYGAVPFELTRSAGHWHTALSSIFIAGSFLQLLANSIALALFGLNVEDAMGRLRFLLFYLLGGLAALAVTVLCAPNSTVPALGSSGAIAAVLGAYVSLYPRARVIGVALIPLLATIVETPATILIALWLLAQLCLGLAGLTGPLSGDWAIAYAAQCGALLLGALLIRPFADAQRRIAKANGPPQPVY
jgi:membrane associated rhomboid family serine protease